MGKRDNQLIMILDIDRAFSADEISAVRTADLARTTAEVAA